MNTMKKFLLAGGAMAIFFLFAGILSAHAAGGLGAPPSFIGKTVTPNPATSTIVVNTSEQGGDINEPGEGTCPGPTHPNQGPWTEEVELGQISWQILSTGLNGTTPVTLTQMGQNSSGCPGGPKAQPWLYAASSSVNISSLAQGPYTMELTLSDDAGNGSTSLPFCVISCTLGGTPTGTIYVQSANSVTGGSTGGTWSIVGSTGLTLNGSGVSSTYTSVPASTTYNYTMTDPSPMSGYAFNPSSTICGAYDRAVNTSTDCGTAAVALMHEGDFDNFLLQWDPLASSTVSPATISLSATQGQSEATTSIAISNVGTVGSELTWTAAASSSGPNGPWLTVSSEQDGGIPVGGTPDMPIVTANVSGSGLSAGSYSGVIMIAPVSEPGGNALPMETVPVTLTVSNSQGGITVSVAPPSASVQTNSGQQFTATTNDPAGVTWSLTGAGCNGSTCGTLSDDTSLTGVPITYTAPSSAPNPPSVTLTATSITNPSVSAPAAITVTNPIPISVSVQPSTESLPLGTSYSFTATVNNDPSGKGVTWSIPLSGCGTDGCGSLSNEQKFSVTYKAPNAFANVILTAASVEDPSATGTAAITAADFPVCPTFTANPTQVVVPESSVLTYLCNYVDRCAISDDVDTSTWGPFFEAGPSSTVSGTESVNPTANTIYELSCSGEGSGPGYNVTTTVGVNVSGTGIGECPPQGCTQ